MRSRSCRDTPEKTLKIERPVVPAMKRPVLRFGVARYAGVVDDQRGSMVLSWWGTEGRANRWFTKTLVEIRRVGVILV